MKNGMHLTQFEYSNWASYFARLFPGAPKEYIDKLCERMIQTLSFCGVYKRMGRDEHHKRLSQLLTALEELPDDSIKGGGHG